MTRIKLNWAKKTPSNLARKFLLGKRGESGAGGGTSSLDYVETPLPPTPVQSLPQVWTPIDDKHLSFSEPATPYLWPTTRFPRIPLDLVPFTPDDLVVPVQVPKINFFDTLLPKEVKIDILKALVDLYIADERKITSSTNWTALKASNHRYRWMGKDKACIELIRLAQVRI
jgi:F-box/leucine-rich repeat protein 2/20